MTFDNSSILAVAQYDLDKEQAYQLLDRIERIEDETAAVRPLIDVMTDLMGAGAAQRLTDLFSTNEIVNVSTTDLITDANEETSLCQVYYVKNGREIARYLSEFRFGTPPLFYQDLIEFNSGNSDRHLFVFDGYIFVDHIDRTDEQACLNWTGYEYINIAPQPNLSDRVGLTRNPKRDTAAIVNSLNTYVYNGRLNTDWVVKQPQHVIENILVYFYETYEEMQNN